MHECSGGCGDERMDRKDQGEAGVCDRRADSE